MEIISDRSYVLILLQYKSLCFKCETTTSKTNDFPIWLVILLNFYIFLKINLMRLFLLRHAHTEKVKGGGSDFGREIDKKGFRQLEKMKIFLKENYASTSFQVFCSPAARTKTTFTEISNSINTVQVDYDHELYLPSRDNLLHFLWKAEQVADDVIIVAHNNGISDLASYLLDEAVVLPTCGLIVISFEGVEKLSEISKGLGVEEDCYLT